MPAEIEVVQVAVFAVRNYYFANFACQHQVVANAGGTKALHQSIT